MQINNKIVTLIKPEGSLYEQALVLRYESFFKQHNLPWEILFDSVENNSDHFAITSHNDLLAYGRLTKIKNDVYQISQMVVCSKSQKSGLGTTLLKEIMAYAYNKGSKSLVLNSRTNVVRFYEKQGFRSDGDVFLSNSTKVPHIKMKYVYIHT